MVTPDEQHALQLENAEADEKFWTGLQDMHGATAEDQRGLAAMASRTAAGLEEGAAEAARKAASAKERRERLPMAKTCPAASAFQKSAGRA